MAATRSPALTFGIELEFLLVHHESVTNPIQLVHDRLQDTFFVKCRGHGTSQFGDVYACAQEHVYSLPLERASDCTIPCTYGWSVVDDGSLCLLQDNGESDSLPDGFVATPIELRSRVYNFGESSFIDAGDCLHYAEEKPLPWYIEIPMVISRLMNAFNQPHRSSEHLRLIVNRTCGFHVHVGLGSIGDFKSFDFDTLMGVLALYTAFERQIDSVLHTNRISGFTGHLDPMHPCLTAEDEPLPRNNHCLPLSHLHNANALAQKYNAADACSSAQEEDMGMEYVDENSRDADTLTNLPIIPTNKLPLDAHTTSPRLESWLSLITGLRSPADIADMFIIVDGHNCAVNLTRVLFNERYNRQDHYYDDGVINVRSSHDYDSFMKANVWASGPLVKDRLFLFAMYEQRAGDAAFTNAVGSTWTTTS